VTFSDHLFVGSDDGTTTIYDVRAIRRKLGECAITTLQGHNGWILDVQSAANGRVVATRCVHQTDMHGCWPFFSFQFDRPNSPAMGFGRIPCDMRNNSVTNDTYMGCVMASWHTASNSREFCVDTDDGPWPSIYHSKRRWCYSLIPQRRCQRKWM